ncbi:MAG: DUF2452 domain-containing protein [Desulfobulbaceae bacterium]|nr:DUF2452 domain-containing protein [Desulfobulbaceae bacterium]
MGDNSSKYPVSRLAPPSGLVDMAREIEQADQMINATVSAKLAVIADQIRSLQHEARKALAEAQKNQELHRAHCAFRRQPGKSYHLYEKTDGSRYFSMLSPLAWRHTPPHRFIGTFRLENDLSWSETADDAGDRRQPGQSSGNLPGHGGI